jgi:hypothetical protein
MKFPRTLPVIFATLALAACGNGNGNPSKAKQEQPQIAIPANALIADYSCSEVSEFRGTDGILQTETVATKGVSYDWSAGGNLNSYTHTADGGEHSYLSARSASEGFDRTRVTGQLTTWTRVNGVLRSTVTSLERLWEKTGNTQRALSNKLNGLDEPYYWEVETVRIDLKNQRIVQRHTYPGARNTNIRAYEKIENTCFYRDREK